MDWKKYLLLIVGAGFLAISILGFTADYTPLAIAGATMVVVGSKKNHTARQ